MRAYIALLVLLAMISIAIQPAMAVKFSIYAYDSGSNMLVQNAFIRVWQDNNLLDSGNTNRDGVFVTYLNDGTKYSIRAEYANKWDEIPDYFANSANNDRINLYLHS
jgi:hypothetical protein